MSGDSTSEEFDLLIPTRMSPAVRGPAMTRIGLLLIALVAALGLTIGWVEHRMTTWGVLFFIGELLVALLTLLVSWTKYFIRNWSAIALINAFAVVLGITLVSIAYGNLAGGVLGLILLEVGSSAFLPWSPTRQFCLNALTLAGLAAFTLVGPRNDPLLALYWLTVLAGAVIGQVACTTLYRYRSELERHIHSVLRGRKALAFEVRQREKAIMELERTQKGLMLKTDEALAAARAKSEFLSTMSHEIRTPLNSVLGMAELLTDAHLKSEERRYLETIQRSGALLLRLINSILDLARLESGRFELVASEFALRTTIEEVLADFAVAAKEKSIQLVTQSASGLPEYVRGDSLRLRQVLINLIGNAIKFTNRGRITITVEPPSDSESNRFRVSVADTGIGIPQDKLALIFEPFTQADSSNAREFGGSGLGLAIVSRLVKEMGGEITVKSEIGKGSTFVFLVRLKPIDSYQEPKSQQPKLKPVVSSLNKYPHLNRRLHLLVADDVPVNRVLIRAQLGHEVWEIDEAQSGREAVGKAIGCRYDAVLMDMQRPALDGYEAASLISDWERQHGINRVPIIAISASVFETDVTRALKAGCDVHLSKPVTRENLLRVLDDQLAPTANYENAMP